MVAKKQIEIRIPDLEKLDVLELANEFGEADISFTEEAMPGGKHGELATTAVIVLGSLSLKLLATWLLKKRSRNRIKRTIEIVDDKGVKRTETIEMDLSSSEAPKADVISALAKLAGVDPESFLQTPS